MPMAYAVRVPVVPVGLLGATAESASTVAHHDPACAHAVCDAYAGLSRLRYSRDTAESAADGEIAMKPYYEEDGITIYHGDCREILPQLGPVDVVITDPPYGIGYEHGSRKNGHRLGFDGISIVGDDRPFNPQFLLRLGREVVLWGANHYAANLPTSRGWLVWDKRGGVPSNDQSDCELAWTNFLTVARLFSRYWNGGGINEPRYHVNQKPLTLMKWCIGLCSSGTILDPFMGSGTTLVAAKNLGRRAIGIEIEERYCEIAVRRLAQRTLFPAKAVAS